MKSWCRQSLLLAFLISFFSITTFAAEAEFVAQHQVSDDTWVTTYKIVNWNNAGSIDEEVPSADLPSDLESMKEYLSSVNSVSRVQFDNATGTFTVVSSTAIDLPEILNK